MSSRHTEFTGSIPEKYDEHLGPLFFEDYAADLARRVAAGKPGRVLEVACGTGLSTRALRDALPDAEIIATDLNDAMLDYARRARGPIATFEQADASELPYDAASFAQVVCQFGIMFFPDKVRAAGEVARVLEPGGRFVFNVWDSLEANPIPRVAVETLNGSALTRYFPDGPPQFLRMPFGYHDTAEIERMLGAAGFSDVEVESVDLRVARPSVRDVTTGLLEGNPGVHELRAAGPEAFEEIRAAVIRALTEAFGDAPMVADLRAIVISAGS